jgi:hypothetical protein
MTPQSSPSEALRACRDQLAAAGVTPLSTSPEQEAELQRLVLEVWQSELENSHEMKGESVGTT